MIFDTDQPLPLTALSPKLDLGNIEDGRYHKVVVSWNAVSQRLSYSFDGQPTGLLDADLVTDYFAGATDVYFGFTGSTGKSPKNSKQSETFISIMEMLTEMVWQIMWIWILTATAA